MSFFSFVEQSEAMQSVPTIFTLQTKHAEYLKVAQSSVSTRPLTEMIILFI